MFFKNWCDIIKLQRIVEGLLEIVPAGFFLWFFGAGAGFIISPHLPLGRSDGMPYRPSVPCKHSGCPALVPYGSGPYCDKHKVLHQGDRDSASKRGYNSRWQKARVRYLHSHPLCVECKKEGELTQATVVDHIVPHRGDQKLFWDESNWQPLCKHCHDKKTWNEDNNPTYKF